MAKPVYIQDAVKIYLDFAKNRAYEKSYYDQMRVFLEYLVENTNGYNLSLKRDCQGVSAN